MTYDLRGASDEMASHHSALYSGSYEEGEQKVFNQVCVCLFQNVISLELKCFYIFSCFMVTGLGDKLFYK